VEWKLEQFRVGVEGKHSCDGCGLVLCYAAYSIPRLAGLYCSMSCIETGLFGHQTCRWCGSKMDKPYTTVDSRLCSEDCSANYYAYVMGDRSAAVGTGKRFSLWLQERRKGSKIVAMPLTIKTQKPGSKIVPVAPYADSRAIG
jgi:hypothetical protein